MNKNNQKNLIGQPIFAQVLGYIPKKKVESIVNDLQSDRYYKKIPTFKHLVSMLFGIISKCCSLREICEGMLICLGKLIHFGIDAAPKRSTFSDANTNRASEVFEKIYYMLVGHYHSLLSDSKIVGLSIKRLFAIDSTTIRLFSNILEGVGRNPKDNGKKKGGVKAHMLIDAKEGIAKFVRITAAKIHDSTFLKDISLPKGSYIVFDKAYNKYKLFAEWTKRGLNFVTRMKDNAVYQVLETKIDASGTSSIGVIKEEIIELSYKDGKEIKTIKLRRITYKDEKISKALVFLSNIMDLPTEEIALIYKNRWQIELLFKKIKQNFQLKYFIGDTENAIKIQIWCTLIAHLLLSIIKKASKTNKAFSTVVTIIRLHLMSYVDLIGFLKNAMKAWLEKDRQQFIQLNLWAT
jgi:hypothetical protein